MKANLKRLGGQRGWAAIAFGDSALALTLARPAPNGDLQVVAESATPWPTGEGAGEPKQLWQTAALELRQKVDPAEHRVVMAVRCEDVLFQTLQLPTTAPGELKQMLDLQIDSLTPLPTEEVVFDFEPLEVTENQTRVLVAVARKDAVNARVEALENVGLPPEVVKVDALAVFRAMLQRQLLPHDDKLNLLVALTPTTANVIVHIAGKPFAIRSVLLEPGALLTGAGQAELREELQRTVVAMQAEYPQRETGTVAFLAATEELRAAAELMADGWGITPEYFVNGSTPTLTFSLCLETGAGEQARLNLLPDEWRQRRHTAQMRRLMVRVGIALAVAYVLALSGFVTLMGVRRTQVRQVREEINRLQPEFAATKALRDELLAMQNQLNTKNSALEVMREVSLTLPETVKLSGFDYRKDLTVKMRGSGQSNSAVTEFISRLEKCPLFTAVKLPSPIRSDPSGLTRFDIVCTLKTATGGAGPAHGTQ